MTPCDHLSEGAYPLVVDLTMDDHLGFTEALTHCRVCKRVYLLELLDWRGPLRLFRVAMPAPADAERLVRNLTRGSCDISRAGAEVQNLRTRNPFCRWLLALDTTGPRIAAVVALADDELLPGAPWRELPCDGSWLDQMRVKSDMLNG